VIIIRASGSQSNAKGNYRSFILDHTEQNRTILDHILEIIRWLHGGWAIHYQFPYSTSTGNGGREDEKSM